MMKLTEKQTDHRIALENMVVKSQVYQGYIGQALGFIIVVFCLGLSTYLALNGQPTIGGIIAGSTVISLAGIFVLGKIFNNKK